MTTGKNTLELVQAGAHLQTVLDSALAQVAKSMRISVRNLLDRVICLQGTQNPILEMIRFEPSLHRGGINFTAEIDLGKNHNRRDMVRVTPLLLHGVPYVSFDQETGHLGKGPAFLCAILWPKKDADEFFRAVPLGYADEKTLDIWERIVTARKDAKHPSIPRIPMEKIPNQPLIFVPQYLEDRGSGRIIGHYFGKKVILTEKSQNPPATLEVEGGVTFDESRPMRFRVVHESEGALFVKHEGFVADLGTEAYADERIVVHIVVNPFDVFGVKIERADWELTYQRAQGYLRAPLNEKNTVYQAALRAELVTNEYSDHQKRAAMSRMLDEANVRLGVILDDKFDKIWSWLKKSAHWPTIDQLTEGGTLRVKDVIERFDDNDIVATWIQAQMGESFVFDEECPLHMAVRHDVIKKAARDASYSDPVNPPQVPEAENVDAKEEVLADAIPVEKPKSKPKRARKPAASKAEKKNGTSGSTPTA